MLETKSIDNKAESLAKISIISDGIVRDVIVVGEYAFYQSSGQSSNMCGTWLPFFGVRQNCHYIIPLADMDVGLMGKYSPFPSSVIMSTREEKNVDLSRFGNLETLYISNCLGGGIWNDNEWKSKLEKPLKAYLLSKNIDVPGPFISVESEPEKEFKLNYGTADDVNKWLVTKGAKNIGNSYGNLTTRRHCEQDESKTLRQLNDHYKTRNYEKPSSFEHINRKDPDQWKDAIEKASKEYHAFFVEKKKFTTQPGENNERQLNCWIYQFSCFTEYDLMWYLQPKVQDFSFSQKDLALCEDVRQVLQAVLPLIKDKMQKQYFETLQNDLIEIINGNLKLTKKDKDQPKADSIPQGKTEDSSSFSTATLIRDKNENKQDKAARANSECHIM